jgi:hypothetical protein
MKLYNLLEKNKNEIIQYIHFGKASVDKLILRVKKQLGNPKEDFYDEEVWTFIMCCGYAIRGKDGLQELSKQLSLNKKILFDKLYIESLPYSPRIKEGNTNLNLAFGNLGIREGTKSGIEFQKCFNQTNYNLRN